MKDIFIVESLRTPFGSFGGSLSNIPAPVLASGVMKELLHLLKLDGSAIDEVILGQVLTGGAGQAPARQASRYAGLPDNVHAMTINKVCGSGLKAVMLAYGSVMLNDSELVLAGGMESMSSSPYASQDTRFGSKMGNSELIDLMIYDALGDPYTGKHMGLITEASVEKYGLSRGEMDDYAERSYRLSQKAIENGDFENEIVPVVTKTRKGEVVIDKDEEPFRVNFEKLRNLKPVFQKGGAITAANASTINDGAGVSLVASYDALKKYNMEPLARIVGYATNSLHPEKFPEAPIGAIEKVCLKTGINISDIGLFEINEAFAAVALMAIKSLSLDINKVNVNGGAIAIGHPVGASGARLTSTLIKEMHRRNVKYGLATLCIGGGEAVSVIFEKAK